MRLFPPGLNPWLLPYLLHLPRKAPRRGEPVHLLLCIADHFEPEWAGPPAEVARARVQNWVAKYPTLFAGFRDSDGRPPRHTFFFPMECYRREQVDWLAVLCGQGFGEVEVHLHHGGETPSQLRRMLLGYKELLDLEHGLLSRRRENDELVYGFIHGNWALDNSRPDGRMCGVNNELDILRETGCYCDFTMPSAPDDPAQVRKINSIYYAVDDPNRPRSHECGVNFGSGPAPDRSLALIQGPLVLDWRRRKWGLLPRVENGCIQGTQPAAAGRIDQWLRARVQVPSRPDWYFVKLHTHGGPEHNQKVLLGEPMVRFHADLARRASEDSAFRYHYVTAREMYNLAKAAEAGWEGEVDEARDFALVPNRGLGACAAGALRSREVTIGVTPPAASGPGAVG